MKSLTNTLKLAWDYYKNLNKPLAQKLNIFIVFLWVFLGALSGLEFIEISLITALLYLALIYPTLLGKSLTWRHYFDFSLVFLTLIITVLFGWKIEEVIILAFIVWTILNPWSTTRYTKGAFYFLIITVLFAYFDQAKYTEITAVYVYYFLILTVVSAIIRGDRGQI